MLPPGLRFLHEGLLNRTLLTLVPSPVEMDTKPGTVFVTSQLPKLGQKVPRVQDSGKHALACRGDAPEDLNAGLGLRTVTSGGMAGGTAFHFQHSAS